MQSSPVLFPLPIAITTFSTSNSVISLSHSLLSFSLLFGLGVRGIVSQYCLFLLRPLASETTFV